MDTCKMLARWVLRSSRSSTVANYELSTRKSNLMVACLPRMHKIGVWWDQGSSVGRGKQKVARS